MQPPHLLPPLRTQPLSALSLLWCLGSGPALVRTTTSETVCCFPSGLPVFTRPTPCCLPSSYAPCVSCLLPSVLEQVLGEEEEGWAQAAVGCSVLETSAVCCFVSWGKGSALQHRGAKIQWLLGNGFLSFACSRVKVTWSFSLGLFC